MKKIYLVLIALLQVSFNLIAQDLQSPKNFLGYEPGTAFTPHHKVVDYMKHLEEASANVKRFVYGETNEGRVLQLMVVSYEEKRENLDQIKKNNLIAAGLESGEINGKHLPIVWLSYNIHGNESVSTEAAMSVLYTLLSKEKTATDDWFNDMLIVIDPCENPDGRDRYVNWYKQTQGRTNNVRPDAWEHHEPWPGGRYNHYLFDLNRDWAWQTQVESQQRKDMYYQFMPHVHVDLHEMGPNSPYFFGPSAEPFHKVITDWQREFHNIIGEYNSTAFDKENWLYFTKEVFDLFYPSYGDTWPTYQGAIGFTYEQGGGGRAGLGIVTDTGDTLTLKDRIDHHYTSSFGTIEAAYSQKGRLIDEFKKFFSDAENNGSGEYKSFVISQDNDPGAIKALLELLDNHHIKYGKVGSNVRLSSNLAYDFKNNSEAAKNPTAGDIVVSTYQPQGKMVRVLFEPKPVLVDSMTYDLTSWALPHVYNLTAFAYRENVAASAEAKMPFAKNEIPEEPPYAYYFEWKDFSDAKLLATLYKHGFKVRFAMEPFTVEGKRFDRGTMIVLRHDNRYIDGLDVKIADMANELEQPLFPASTGFIANGKDLGSSSVRFIERPEVAIVNGEGVYPTAFGEVWHYFEEQLQYPVTVINTTELDRADLEEFDVLILVSGAYYKYSRYIDDFARDGGKVIAIERAINLFNSEGNTLLGQANAGKEDSKGEEKQEDLLKKYGERRREALSESVEGSIYKVYLDETHPIAFGAGTSTFLMKRNSSTMPYLGDGGWNVGVFKEDSYTSGFAGYKLREKVKNTLAIGIERRGTGQLIYMSDSPIIRGFWHSGKLLLANAVFLSGQ